MRLRSRPRILALLGTMAFIMASCNLVGGGGASGIQLIGADGLMSDTYVTIPETEGMFFSGPALSDVEAYAAFVEKYETKEGTGPIQAFHAHAYDATNILLDAIDSVAVPVTGGGGGLTINREELRAAMYATNGFEGLTGTLTCNAFGDCAEAAVSVYENVNPEDSMGGLFSNVRFTSEPEGVEGKGGAPAAADPAPGEVTIAAGDPIEIASLQAISGAVASLGTDQVTAIEIAIEDRGQIKGYDISLDSGDDLCSAEGGQAGAERIRANPQIVGVIGTSCSGAQAAAMPILAAAGIVMISGSNTSPALTATGYLEEGDLVQGESWMPGFFRTAHNDEFQGQGAAQFVYENLGLTKAATIHDGDPYTEGLVSQFAIFFEALGGEIVLATSVNKGDTDMRPVLTEVQAAEPEVLYFPIFQPEGDFVVRQAQEVFGE